MVEDGVGGGVELGWVTRGCAAVANMLDSLAGHLVEAIPMLQFPIFAQDQDVPIVIRDADAIHLRKCACRDEMDQLWVDAVENALQVESSGPVFALLRIFGFAWLVEVLVGIKGSNLLSILIVIETSFRLLIPMR